MYPGNFELTMLPGNFEITMYPGKFEITMYPGKFKMTKYPAKFEIRLKKVFPENLELVASMVTNFPVVIPTLGKIHSFRTPYFIFL